jgi:hypothetical protein
LDELSGPENPFLGVWRITDMEFWGSEGSSPDLCVKRFRASSPFIEDQAALAISSGFRSERSR